MCKIIVFDPAAPIPKPARPKYTGKFTTFYSPLKVLFVKSRTIDNFFRSTFTEMILNANRAKEILSQV